MKRNLSDVIKVLIGKLAKDGDVPIYEVADLEDYLKELDIV